MIEHTNPEAVGLSSDRLQRITPWMSRYVEDGKLAGCLTAVTRRGKLVYLEHAGMADSQIGRPVAEDTVFRIYSMTKPIVSAAAMTFFEEGLFQLDDPVARFLPEFSDTPVWVASEGSAMRTDPQTEPMKIWHLLTHTAGLVYGARNDTPVGAMCREKGIDFSNRNEGSLGDIVRRLATIPVSKVAPLKQQQKERGQARH